MQVTSCKSKLERTNMTEIQGKAIGGKARAESLSHGRRKEIAIGAAAAKKALALLPKATHTGELRLVDVTMPCAVLEDGTRVLTQSDFMTAMGMYYSGWVANNVPDITDMVPAAIPHFLAQKTLIPFVNKHLGHLPDIVLKYRTTNGTMAHGIRAEIIPSICDIYLDAEAVGGLGVRQKKIAQRAMLLMRALAHVGIVALVDEATGYQRDRARDALAKILEAYVAKELQPYVKTFDAAYYEHTFRLRGLPFPPEKAHYRPGYFGHLTNDVVYKRLAPGVLEALKEESKKIQKSTKLFQLTAGYGRQELLKHLGMVVGLMKLSDDWQEFMAKLNRVAPRYGETFALELEEKDR
jgi:hypothetical protein